MKEPPVDTPAPPRLEVLELREGLAEDVVETGATPP